MCLLGAYHRPTYGSGGNSYYVDSNKGNDSNKGAISSPFRTIKKGVSILKPGDKLLLRAGLYEEAFSSTTLPGGTSWNSTITIAAYPGEQVTIKPRRDPSVHRVFSFDYGRQSYIVLDGLILDGSNVIDHVIKITYVGTDPAANHAGHIRVINCEIRNAPASGIAVGEGNAGGYNELINLNVHHNGTSSSPPGPAHGIYIFGSHNLVQDCEVHHNGGYGVHVYWKEQKSVDNNVIRNNRIHDNDTARGPHGGAGIILSSGKGNAAYDNVVWNNQGGIRIDYGASDSQVYNNTIYGNDQFGIYLGEACANTIIKNNIIYKNRGNIGDKGKGTIFSNNLASDPKFIDADRHDFHLQPGSPAIGAGTDVGLHEDCEHNAVASGGTPDVGAYAYRPMRQPEKLRITGVDGR
jgi:parallel beta-helix repeat protein